MRYKKLIVSMENAITAEETRPVTDNIMASVPVKTEVENEQPVKLDEVVVETNPTDVSTDILSSDLEPTNGQEAQINQDLDDLEMVNSALEAYHTILKKSMDRHGILDRQVMLAVNHSLECFGLSPITNRFVSLENYNQTNALQQRVASEDFIKGIGDKISAGAKKLYEALRKFLEWIQNFYRTWITNSESKLKRLREIKEKVSKAKDIKNIAVKSPRSLMVDDIFVLNEKELFDKSLKNYNSLINQMANRSKSIMIRLPVRIQNLVNKYKVDKFNEVPTEALIEWMNKEIDNFKSQLDLDLHELKGELDLDGNVLLSDPFPGNYYYYLKVDELNGIPYPVTGFEQSTEMEAPEEKWFETDKATLSKIIDNLIANMTDISSHRNNMDGFDRVSVKLEFDDNTLMSLITKLMKAVYGDITKVYGRYDNFVNATCAVIEKAIVE